MVKQRLVRALPGLGRKRTSWWKENPNISIQDEKKRNSYLRNDFIELQAVTGIGWAGIQPSDLDGVDFPGFDRVDKRKEARQRRLVPAAFPRR